VLTGGDTSLILWDADSGQEIRRLRGHTGLIGNVALLPDGRRAVSGSFDRTIRLWDLESGQELHRFVGHPREVTWVAVSPDGRRLLSSDYNGHELRLWDVDGRKLIRRIDWGNTPPTKGRSARTAGTLSGATPMGPCGCIGSRPSMGPTGPGYRSEPGARLSTKEVRWDVDSDQNGGAWLLPRRKAAGVHHDDFRE
jgi:WD40 repeat protein